MAPILTKKICLITPGHLTSNPRLVKEAQALAANGYAVHLIFTQYVNYLIDFDNHILNHNPTWTYDCLDRTSKNIQTKTYNFITASIQKICVMLLLSGKNTNSIASQAINRFHSWQLKKAIEAKAGLYIAHNLAALPVAVLAAKKHKVKCGFDAEDFHRNEVSDDPKNADVKLKTFIENKYFPQTNYLTASSFPIAELYQKLFPAKKITTVLNVFPVVKEVLPPVTKPNQPLKLFWFSQTIGLNRGLQDAFSALKFLNTEKIELHLLGYLDNQTKNNLDKLLIELQIKQDFKVIFHQPINPDQLPIYAAQFDVGLALEPGFSINNNAALSNKIFTYLQAGLAVIASDTIAQKQFIAENPGLGFCYEKGNTQQLATILKQLIEKPELLLKTKQQAYRAARLNLNWETESLKFLQVVSETLSD